MTNNGIKEVLQGLEKVGLNVNNLIFSQDSLKLTIIIKKWHPYLSLHFTSLYVKVCAERQLKQESSKYAYQVDFFIETFL